MTERQVTATGIVDRVRSALESADLEAIGELLDPGVRWGAPDDQNPSCQNRQQVLAWYRRGREAGVRAHVTETVVYGDRILVGLAVTGRPGAEQAATLANRWQVLTVGAGGVVDIRGFDIRDEVVARAEMGPSH